MALSDSLNAFSINQLNKKITAQQGIELFSDIHC